MCLGDNKPAQALRSLYIVSDIICRNFSAYLDGIALFHGINIILNDKMGYVP